MPHHIVPDGSVTKTKLVEKVIPIASITLVRFYVTDVGGGEYVCDYALAYKDASGNVLEEKPGILTMAQMSVALMEGIHNLESLVLADLQAVAGAESGAIVSS